MNIASSNPSSNNNMWELESDSNTQKSTFDIWASISPYQDWDYSKRLNILNLISSYEWNEQLIALHYLIEKTASNSNTILKTPKTNKETVFYWPFNIWEGSKIMKIEAWILYVSEKIDGNILAVPVAETLHNGYFHWCDDMKISKIQAVWTIKKIETSSKWVYFAVPESVIIHWNLDSK